MPELNNLFQVTIVDLPGYGHSPYDSDDYFSLIRIAELVLNIAPQKATWLGWSLGDLITLQAAQHAPERIEKLINVSSTPKFTNSNDWPGINLPTLDTLTKQIKKNVDKTLSNFFCSQFKNIYLAKNDVINMKQYIFSNPSYFNKHVLLNSLMLLKHTDTREKLKSFNKPQLLMKISD